MHSLRHLVSYIPTIPQTFITPVFVEFVFHNEQVGRMCRPVFATPEVAVGRLCIHIGVPWFKDIFSNVAALRHELEL